ncbi:hypothetical protein [Okeania sp.]|uniref:hypothetical protein n=1 Tax=Okeania sp. TaxID=3100323 RepID=UPI002B4ADA06|nr:hypothetical protein [Okeania sp.]
MFWLNIIALNVFCIIRTYAEQRVSVIAREVRLRSIPEESNLKRRDCVTRA